MIEAWGDIEMGGGDTSRNPFSFTFCLRRLYYIYQADSQPPTLYSSTALLFFKFLPSLTTQYAVRGVKPPTSIAMSTKKRKREEDADSTDSSGATSLEPHEEEVLRRFLGGLSLGESQAQVVSDVIARQVQLSIKPDIELVQEMSRYRRLFGSLTSPFNSMA